MGDLTQPKNECDNILNRAHSYCKATVPNFGHLSSFQRKSFEVPRLTSGKAHQSLA